jgi:NADH-quinone oxidoreductase subunit H
VVAAALFLGGYDIPFVDDAALHAARPWLASSLGVLSYAAKCAAFAYLYVWIRATFPRYRYDQLLRVGWLVLLPLALVNLVVVSLVKLALLR